MIRAGRNVCSFSTAATSALSLTILLSYIPEISNGQVIETGVSWLPKLGLNVNFFLDGLGFFFASLILVIGLLIIIYSRFYLDKDESIGKFFSYLLLFQGAMLGIVLSNNILLLLIFWELTSLSSFLLIGYRVHSQAGRQGARMALAVTGAGGLSMIAGMLLIGSQVGSYDLTVILTQASQIQNSDVYLPALLLILLGCFTKSAQFPFHFWLPQAMAAPTPVSAYLHSATMVKAGLFLMARMWPVLSGTPVWFYVVSSIGLITMLIGAIIALFKDDLKALLAYSTISQLGLITMLLGFGSPLAFVTAIFHILNHAIFKAALFMNAGIIDYQTGSRSFKKLGGLFRPMPMTAIVAIAAAGAMAGIPLLNGFLSKEMMLEEATKTSLFLDPMVTLILVTFGSLFSVAYSLRYILHIYFGKSPRLTQEIKDPKLGLILPSLLLAVMIPLIGVFPEQFASGFVRMASGVHIMSQLPSFKISLWHGFTLALGMSLIALVLGALLLRFFTPIENLFNRFPLPNAKSVFDGMISLMLFLTRKLTDFLHNGSLQRYIGLTIITTFAAGTTGFLTSPFESGQRPTLPLSFPAITGWILLISASFAVVFFHRNRFLSLVMVGVIGLMTSMAFVLFSAPDLALTQVSVEVVTVILMLLALAFLPATTPKESRPIRKLIDLAIAGLSGFGVAALSYFVMTREFKTISDYYLKESLPRGGGSNVVNVILVDFRGFDTFGEITVLGIAGLTIFALLDGLFRGRTAQRIDDIHAHKVRSSDRHPMMMVVMTRLMLPMALLAGVYIFLRGHSLPGGGFVAALVVSIALIMQYMASGYGWAAKKLRVNYHSMIGIGVVTAGLTGLGSVLFEAPFLTSTFTHVHLPVIGDFELASAMGFDAGVFLTVVGSVMLTLANLARLSRHTGDLPINEAPMDELQPSPSEK